ncbi:MAG: RpiB/LacA/LacB family sugar-phosphate isomerase [Thermoguttaceae bacterium]|jgi:ribose 5-phosphate isomerase B
MNMAAGSDGITHLTEVIVAHLREKGVAVTPCGALAGKPADYVDAAREVAEAVASGACQQGILFCNTGTGVTIVANKVPGVRAAPCPDAHTARIARLANNANVLVLGMRLTGEMAAKEIVDAWLATAPSDEPRRIVFHRKTDEVDRNYRKTP